MVTEISILVGYKKMAAASLVHTQTSHSKGECVLILNRGQKLRIFRLHFFYLDLDTVSNSPERLSVPSPFSSSVPDRRPLPPIQNGNLCLGCLIQDVLCMKFLYFAMA